MTRLFSRACAAEPKSSMPRGDAVSRKSTTRVPREHGINSNAVMAPSAVQDPYEGLTPHPLTEHQIEELVVAFAHAIRRTKEAGLDAAEIHGAHGYLVNEFLSPYFNRRTDRWGATRADRVRFTLAVIAEARGMVGPDFPIGVRVGVDGDGAIGGSRLKS